MDVNTTSNLPLTTQTTATQSGQPQTTSDSQSGPSAADLAQAGRERVAAAKASWSQQGYAERLPSSYADQVSLSYKSQQLSQISAEFFGGTIRSDQIAALTQRLYEGGLISAADYQALGGVEQKVSAVSEAQSFLSQQVMSREVQADSELEAQFTNVIEVLRNMDGPANAAQREAEQQAMAFIEDYQQQQQAAGADSELLAGLDQVKAVLTALEKVRNNDQATAALASYNSVQEAYEDITE
jgi:hypothetical protein